LHASLSRHHVTGHYIKTHEHTSKYTGQVITSSGQIIPWENEIRYLGIYITRSSEFKCSLDIAKQSFYRAANAIFGKVGRHASEEVILQLVSSKCVPVLLYGLEACPLNKISVNSLDFVIDRFFMKLFKTNNIDTVRNCQKEFAFELPSVIHVPVTANIF